MVFYTTATHRKLSIFNENQKKIQQKTRNQQINTKRITAIGTANTTKIVDKFECRTIQIRMSNNSKIAASNCQTWNVTWCGDLPETKQKKLQNDDWRELKRHSVASQCTLRDVIMQTRCHSVHIHKSSVVIDFNKLLLLMMLVAEVILWFCFRRTSCSQHSIDRDFRNLLIIKYFAQKSSSSNLLNIYF